MRFVTLTAVLLLALAATAAHATDAAQPTTKAKAKHAKPAATSAKRAKPAAMSEEKRRDLERRVEALERKYEMQYRETDTPTGAPGAESAPKPATH
jgi:Ni/Co efflux regulator RcnB